MTEEQWWEANNPYDLLEFVGDRMSDRLLDSFAQSCCDMLPRGLLATCTTAMQPFMEAIGTVDGSRVYFVPRSQWGSGIRRAFDSATLRFSSVIRRSVQTICMAEFLHNPVELFNDQPADSPLLRYDQAAFSPKWHFALFTAIEVSEVYLSYFGHREETEYQADFLSRLYQQQANLFRCVVPHPDLDLNRLRDAIRKSSVRLGEQLRSVHIPRVAVFDSLISNVPETFFLSIRGFQKNFLASGIVPRTNWLSDTVSESN